MTIARRVLLAAPIALAAPPLVRAQPRGPITIALAGPMTGGSAAFGQNAQRGTELALEAINRAGGIGGQPVQVEVFDDRSNPRDAAAVAQRIARNDHFLCVLGHVDSSATLAAMPIYSEERIPVVNASSSNPTITEQGWTNFVRLTIRGDYGAQQYSAYAVNNLGRRNLGILFVNNDFGRALRNDMVRAAQALNARVTGDAGFTPNVDRDFSAVVSQFRAAGTDVVMLNTSYTEGGLFAGQMRSAGWSVPLIGPDTLLYDQFLALSQGGAEGAWIMAAYDPYADRPATRTFMESFQQRFNTLPSQVAVFTHDIYHLLKQVVEAGATRANLIQRIKATTFEGAGGRYAWNAKGDVQNRTFAVIQVRGGRFTSTGLSVDERGLESLRG
jgi:branched-chain amino acid transport system substrate-binding protein